MTYANIKNYRERGFTIVELLIVIIVIGILATLVLIAYNNVQGQARDTKRQSDATTLKEASETYHTSSSLGYYPRTTAGQSPAGSDFQSDISTAGNYTSGSVGVSVDSTVSALLNPGSTAANSVPSSGNPNYIEAIYCPSGATNSNATGMRFYYWQESKTTGGSHVFSITTGTGC